MVKHTLEVETVLFDMDGTLIDSTPAVEQTWVEFCDQYKLDWTVVRQSCHGCRTVENLRRFIPSLTEEELPEEVKRFEGRISEIALDAVAKGPGAEGRIVALPGTVNLLREINAGPDENPLRRAGWAIVTSATSAYASQGFAASESSPKPPVTFVTSDLVSRGKPAPDPYLLGAKMSGSNPASCLVVEDAPPGVVAGKAAGCKVLALKTTHDSDKMWEAGADFLCEDLSCVRARWEGLKLIIEIDGEEKPTHLR
ncbi:unnamed protein product [Parajaminaea phylloscopi]